MTERVIVCELAALVEISVFVPFLALHLHSMTPLPDIRKALKRPFHELSVSESIVRAAAIFGIPFQIVKLVTGEPLRSRADVLRVVSSVIVSSISFSLGMRFAFRFLRGDDQ